jgi:beta-glucosidase
MKFSKSDFGPDFIWGVSSSAYQTEGGWDADGKGKSIWDAFSNIKGKIYKDKNVNVACDFYHLYLQDLEILHRLGIPNFRFSISWSRILPAGTGTVNMAGIDFYNRVIDQCLKHRAMDNLVPLGSAL